MKRKTDPAHRQTDQELAALEKRIAAEYKKAADEMQGKVDAYFARLKKRDEEQLALLKDGKITRQQYTQWRLAQIGRGKRFEALRDRLAERMTNANEVAAAYINGEMPKIYAMNRRYSIDEAVKQSGGMLDGSDFILWDENAVKRLLAEQPDLMPYYPKERAVKRGIDLAYGKRKITEYVTSGILQGAGIKEIARNLMDNVENMERVSAVRAARTAVTNAANGGRQDADAELSEKGAIIEKEWISMMLPTTRHPHAHANGQRVPWDEPFTVGGEKLMFPADGSMGASGWNLYNCQCVRARKVVGYRSILLSEKKAVAKIRVIDTEAVAQPPKSGIIKPESGKGGGSSVQKIGKIDIEKYTAVSPNIRTSDVVITDERIAHIKERHPNDFERYSKYISEMLLHPQYILADPVPDTAVILQEFSEGNEHFRLILKLAVTESEPGKKNSVITFLKISEKKFRKYLRNKKILYKSE